MLPNENIITSKEEVESSQNLFDQFQKLESEGPVLVKKYKAWIDERNKKRGIVNFQTKPAELHQFEIEKQEVSAKLEASTVRLRLSIIDEIRGDLQPEKMYKLHKGELLRIDQIEFTRKVLIPHELMKINYESRKIQEMMKDTKRWDKYCQRIEKENEPRYGENDCFSQVYFVKTNRSAVNSVREILEKFLVWLLNEARLLPIQKILDEKEKVQAEVLKVDLSKMEEIEMDKDSWEMYETYMRGNS